jgi:hypothetical protein
MSGTFRSVYKDDDGKSEGKRPPADLRHQLIIILKWFPEKLGEKFWTTISVQQ